MKPVAIVTLLFAFLSFSFSANPAQDFKRYGVKSGIIEYELTGAQSGKEIIYFDDYGSREAKFTETEMSFGGFSQKVNTLNIIEGKMIYTIDLATNTGTKAENPIFNQFDPNGEKSMMEIGEQMMRQMGGQMIGQETVLGKTCDLWEVRQLQSKTWIWEGIPLKMDINMGMQMNSVATSIKEGPVPQEKLEIPSGITFQDLGDMSDLMNKMKKGGN